MDAAIEQPVSFGYWIRRRRKALDWTQAELGRRVGASAAMIRKIEADERRPSRELAELLADHLLVPDADRAAFLRAARGVLALESLRQVEGPVSGAPLLGPPTNLPAPMTSMINRVNDLAKVTALLMREDVRLVTVAGPPGMGKTRLSIQTASQLLPRFADGAWFVDLASVTDPALLFPAIAEALELSPTPGQTLAKQLSFALRNQRLLLVLDNLEQIAGGAAVQIADLLRACPFVKVIATSRRRLDIYGEHEYLLPPMSLPPRTGALTPAELLGFESVQLFVARIRQHDLDFELTTATAPTVAEICRRMDGLPLALELAAARTRRMPVDRLAAALRDTSGADWHELLQTSARDRPPRQQTLYNAIAWSYSYLEADLQRMLTELSVFVGVFDWPAVAAVTAWSQTVDGLTQREALDRLVDHNLVSQVSRSPERWRLLEMVREFTLSKLDEAEKRSVQKRHASHFADQQWLGTQDWVDPPYLAIIDRDAPNYRAAIAFAMDEADAATTFKLVASMGRYWERNGFFAEGRPMLDRVLALGGEVDPRLRFAVLHEACILAWMQADLAHAERYATEALELARQNKLPEAILAVLNLLGRLYLEGGRYAEADRVLAEGIELKSRSTPPRAAGMEIIQRGEGALALGDLDTAEQYLRRGLALIPPEEFIPYCIGWTNLAELSLAKGDVPAARESLDKVLPLVHLHVRRLRIFMAAVAGMLLADPEADPLAVRGATKLLGYNTAAIDRLGDPLSLVTRRLLASRLEASRALMSTSDWHAAWDEGLRWTDEDALAFATQVFRSRA